MRDKINEAGARIIENSPFARIACMVLKSPNVAMVLGKQIHLSGVKTEDFLQDRYWVEHELCHIRQVKEHGLLKFLALYLLESVKHGYHDNKFEAEARAVGRAKAQGFKSDKL